MHFFMQKFHYLIPAFNTRLYMVYMLLYGSMVVQIVETENLINPYFTHNETFKTY